MFAFCMKATQCDSIVVKVTVIPYCIVSMMVDVLKLKYNFVVFISCTSSVSDCTKAYC